MSESLRKYTPSVIQKKAPKSLQHWSSFGTLLGSLGALHALPSPSKWAAMTCSCPPRASKAPFWDAFGTLGVTAKRAIAIVFLRLDSASSGPKAIVHFTLMRLRQHKITTCSVYTATVLALHRLAAPRAPETNLKFQISDQRWSLCIPCICDCCSIGVKITTCMDMHGSALVYI